MADQKNILFLDDDTKLAARLKGELVPLRLELISCTSTAQLTEGFKRGAGLLIINGEWAAESGYAVLRRLKKDAGAAKLPVIITSGAKTAKDDFKRHRTQQQPADGYLEKPYTLLDLLDLVCDLIQLPDPLVTPQQQLMQSQSRIAQLEKELKQKAAAPVAAQKPDAGDSAALQKQLQALQAERDEHVQRNAEADAKHKKAQQALRDFYREKLQKLETEQGDADAQYQLEQLQATVAQLTQDLENEKRMRKKISEALKALES